MINFNLRDNISIGVCYPKNTVFQVRYKVFFLININNNNNVVKRGNTFTTMAQVTTLAAVDANTNGTLSPSSPLSHFLSSFFLYSSLPLFFSSFLPLPRASFYFSLI